MVQAKACIHQLAPYQYGHHTRELIKNHLKTLKLDSNESTIGPSPRVVGSVIQYVHEGPLNWYPDIKSAELCQQLSLYTGLPESCVLTFNGSDHALETIVRTYIEPGDHVIYFQPTYDHFRVYVQSCDGMMIPQYETGPKTLGQKIAQACTAKTKMVYVVNPNNPTGYLTSQKEILEALVQFPRIVFIVDEAYFEFSGLTVAPCVFKHPNLIVTRSFSKAFGLAGLRCGYMLAHPQRCEEVTKIRVGKNINALAQVAATAALKDLDYMMRYVQDVLDTKRWLIEKMRSVGLSVKDTPANFILIKMTQPNQVMQFLESQNIYVRDRSNIPELKGFIRLTVGDKLSMKRFWKIFKTIPIAWITQPQKQPHLVLPVRNRTGLFAPQNELL